MGYTLLVKDVFNDVVLCIEGFKDKTFKKDDVCKIMDSYVSKNHNIDVTYSVFYNMNNFEIEGYRDGRDGIVSHSYSFEWVESYNVNEL